MGLRLVQMLTKLQIYILTQLKVWLREESDE